MVVEAVDAHLDGKRWRLLRLFTTRGIPPFFHNEGVRVRHFSSRSGYIFWKDEGQEFFLAVPSAERSVGKHLEGQRAP